jgi:hypothetical protein
VRALHGLHDKYTVATARANRAAEIAREKAELAKAREAQKQAKHIAKVETAAAMRETQKVAAESKLAIREQKISAQEEARQRKLELQGYREAYRSTYEPQGPAYPLPVTPAAPLAPAVPSSPAQTGYGPADPYAAPPPWAYGYDPFWGPEEEEYEPEPRYPSLWGI